MGQPSGALRTESVTHVFGMTRNPCLRIGPAKVWRPRLFSEKYGVTAT